MFAIASGVMRNDLLVFKYSNQHRIAAKKGTLTEMTTRCQSLVTCHSLSLVVTRCHSLSLVVTRCQYHSSVFLSRILEKHLKIRRRHLYVFYKKNALTKLKLFKENVESCFNKLNLGFIKTVLHHGHINAECFDLSWERYFTK